MVKQFKAISKDKEKTSKDQYMGYAGEPLDKFKKRLEKDGADLNLYEITNSDIIIDEDGHVIIGKIMKLMKDLELHVTSKRKILDTHSNVNLPDMGGADGSNAEESGSE